MSTDIMDKIDRLYVNFVRKESSEALLANKVNELIEGYNEIMKRLEDKNVQYIDLRSRLEILEGNINNT